MRKSFRGSKKIKQPKLLFGGLAIILISVVFIIVIFYLTQTNWTAENRSDASDAPISQSREDFLIDNKSTKIVKSVNGISSSIIQNGTLNITFKPGLPHYSSHAVSREFTVDMSRPAFFSVKTRMAKQLIGQDMYSKFTFYPNGKPLSIILGVNGEQHWQQTYYQNPSLGSCVPKNADNEYFIAVSPEIFPNATDTRLNYPDTYTKPYTSWTTYSFRYDPPVGTSPGKITFYVDNRVVTVRALDAPQLGVIPTTTNAFKVLGPNSRVTFTAELLTDGTEYSYPGNKFGIRGRGCYAISVPSVPSKTVFPKKFTTNNGSSYKQPWMTKYDAVAKTFFDSLKVIQTYPISDYKALGQLSPDGNQTIGNANPATLPAIYDSFVKNNPTLKQQIEKAIWQKIFEGKVDFETAVLMQLIPLPDTSHVQWKYVPADTRDRLFSLLADINRQYSSKHKFRRWPMHIMYTQGGTSDMIFFGYLTPEDITNEAVWNYLSTEEKNSIPKPSQPTTGSIFWDFVEVKN